MKDKDLVWCSYCGASICKPNRLPKVAKDNITHFCSEECLELCVTETPEAFEECMDEFPVHWRN